MEPPRSATQGAAGPAPEPPLLFSSAGAVSGQLGQLNYNADNVFLDALAAYRKARGLAASTINIGVIGDVGYVADNPEVLDSLGPWRSTSFVSRSS